LEGIEQYSLFDGTEETNKNPGFAFNNENIDDNKSILATPDNIANITSSINIVVV
jgi:hypothetical protein